MLNDLSLHDATKKLVEAYIRSPKHSLLLSGTSGVGLGTLARAVATELVQHTTDILVVAPDEKGTIPIERVRTLYIDTRDVHSTSQVVIVDDIDAMSLDAQNAFLKLLEEPNEQVYFILTTHAPEQLLPTIRSRVQSIQVRPISGVESQSLLRAHHISDATKLQQMLFIANGLPAELLRLAHDEAYFAEKARFVRLARDFLSGKTYDRLVLISQLSDRLQARYFVSVLANLLQFMSRKDPGTVSTTTVEIVETTAERLSNNGHVRTQLTNLALNMV